MYHGQDNIVINIPCMTTSGETLYGDLILCSTKGGILPARVDEVLVT